MAPGTGEIQPDRHLVVAQRLRQRRDALGLTQQQVVARLAGMGLRTSNRALSNLERGAGVDVGRLPELATALECTVTFLLGLTDQPDRWGPDLGEPPGHRENAATSPTVPLASTRVPRHSQPNDADSRANSERHSWILGMHVPDRGLLAGRAAHQQTVNPPVS